MFKSLFTKRNSDVRKNAESSDVQIVEQIHKEFNTASDDAYNEALSIINGTSTEALEKIEKLKRFGFTKSSDITGTKKQVAAFHASKKRSEMLTYYREKYPQYKFISNEDVVRICKKYALLCGPTSSFVGSVPDKNLKEIEKFRILTEEFLYATTILKIDFRYDTPKSNTEEVWKVLKKIGVLYSPSRLYDSDAMARISEECSNHGVNASNIRNVTIRSERDDVFMICAPAKDFDGRDLERDGSFLNKSHEIIMTKQPVPDPVVLKRVKDGFLIVTAWGLEASDPLVVNEKMN